MDHRPKCKASTLIQEGKKKEGEGGREGEGRRNLCSVPESFPAEDQWEPPSNPCRGTNILQKE